MTIRTAYRHFPDHRRTGEARGLGGLVCGANDAGQIAANRFERKLELDNVAQRVAELEINDVGFDVA
ncbi:MAG: hypothetical protein ACRET4_00915 [Steroidobacteraceae bacterium]